MVPLKKNTQISVSQLVCLLLASRLTTAMTASPAGGPAGFGSSMLVSVVLQIPLLLILLLPTWWFSRRTNRSGTIDYAYVLFGPKGGGAVAALYGLLCLVIVNADLLRFQTFVSVALSPGMSRIALCGTLVVGVFFAASCGLQAVARAAGVAVVVVIAAMVFTLFSLLPEMRGVHFLSPLYDGVYPVVEGALYELPRSIEVAVVGMLLPYVRGSSSKGYAVWTTVLAGVLVLMQATITGVLGDFAAQVRFPYYTAVTAADVGIIQRMDLIAVAVWLVVLFVKMAFYSMLYMSCAQRIFGKNRKPLYAVAGGGTVFVTGLSFAGLAAQSEQEASVPVYLIIAGLFAVALPLVLVLADMVRERRARRARA
ncbi:MAG: GerAB/ArcD/ProY family transporter [Clostridiales bacterium]|nr:GerAB/ArcD/ProY family transporter [Clostridiales bacterium]